MEGLTIQDWSLIARYLREEANHNDLVQLNGLLDTHPLLKAELHNIADHLSESSGHLNDEFDADKAFQELHQRFKKENLI